MRAKLSNLQSIPQVVAEMTLDEKLDMVGCYRACHTRPIPDMDVPAINEKLMVCKAELLLSNPCFEIWLLLHAKEQKSALSSEAVLKELKKSASVWNSYNKSVYTDTQKTFLREHLKDAVDRAKALKDFQNPSSRIYRLLEILEGKA